ncbi:MAG: insulinase family protein, partial [Bdellovibrionales bacterium]|nr:insulinase family protein [Bdellovibrionales bacterium]
MIHSPRQPHKLKLPNGGIVLVDADSRFQSMAYAVCLRGGLRGERREELGLTHLLEHLLFKRTRQADTFAIARRIDELGGDINAFTDADSMCVHGLVPASRGAALMALIDELVTDFIVRDDDFEREREVIRQEILDAEDDPGHVSYQRFAETLWQGNILGEPIF